MVPVDLSACGFISSNSGFEGQLEERTTLPGWPFFATWTWKQSQIKISLTNYNHSQADRNLNPVARDTWGSPALLRQPFARRSEIKRTAVIRGGNRATFSGGYDGQSWRVVRLQLIPGRVAFHYSSKALLIMHYSSCCETMSFTKAMLTSDCFPFSISGRFRVIVADEHFCGKEYEGWLTHCCSRKLDWRHILALGI